MIDKLTPMQKKVLSELRKGYNNKQIADALGIADATVKVHLRTIYRKLGVHSRLELVIKVRENISYHSDVTSCDVDITGDLEAIINPKEIKVKSNMPEEVFIDRFYPVTKKNTFSLKEKEHKVKYIRADIAPTVEQVIMKRGEK